MTRERSFPRLIVAGALVAASAGLLTSCSSSGGSASKAGSSSSSTGSPISATDTVQVKDFSFEPGDLTVAKGTKVTWDFDDTTAHTVTSTTKAFGSKGLAKGGVYSFTFNTAGKYNYICTFHQYMKGTITVK